MKTNTKFYRMHDTDLFTGENVNGYLVFTKQDGETILAQHIEEFFDESHKCYLINGSQDALKAFPLKQFNSEQQMKNAFNLELDPRVTAHVEQVKLTMFDSTTLKCDLTFFDDVQYDRFNKIVGENSAKIPHGFTKYLCNIYYAYK